MCEKGGVIFDMEKEKGSSRVFAESSKLDSSYEANRLILLIFRQDRAASQPNRRTKACLWGQVPQKPSKKQEKIL